MYAKVVQDNKVILTSSKKADGLTPIQSLTCGGIAGAASRTVTSPLDVVKILFQVQSHPIKTAQGVELSGATAGRTVYTGMGHAFSTIYREEGLRAFWKGNGVACLRLFPYSAVKFFVFDELKPIFMNKDGKLTPHKSVICGATAGIMATLVTYPLDLIKTRLTVQNEGHAEKAYNGVMDAVAKIYRMEGVRGWYKGAYTSVIGVIPFEGGTFMFYEVLKNLSKNEKARLSPAQNFLNGCLGAAFAQTFSYPFDLVRKRLQAQSKAKGMLGEQYAGMSDCFSKIMKHEGFFGLYKGTVANLAKVAPYAGIMFATWEQCKLMFQWYNKKAHPELLKAKSAATGSGNA